MLYHELNFKVHSDRDSGLRRFHLGHITHIRGVFLEYLWILVSKGLLYPRSTVSDQTSLPGWSGISVSSNVKDLSHGLDQPVL